MGARVQEVELSGDEKTRALTETLQTTLGDLEAASAAQQASQEELAHLRSELEAMSADMHDSETSAQELREAQSASQDTIQQLQSELDGMIKREEELVAFKASADGEKAALCQELEAMSAHAHGSETLARELREAHSVSQDTIQQLQSELEGTTKRKEELVAELVAAIAEKEAAKEIGQADLATLTSALEEASTKVLTCVHQLN